jgi:hypothetical protein
MPLWQRQKIQTLLRQNRISVEHSRGAFVVLPPAIGYWLCASPVLPFCHNGITIHGMKTLTIKLPDALFAEIAGAAKARNVPKSEIVRERLARKPITSKRASLWSSMEDLVIQEDALPTDLSSSRKHLKGYGKNRPHR